MWPWIKRFFLDETAFAGMIRGVLMGLGGAQMSGMLDDIVSLPKWFGVLGLMGAGFIRSSQAKLQPWPKQEPPK